jgi:hypothetical protein
MYTRKVGRGGPSGRLERRRGRGGRGARVRTPYALVWQFSPPSKQWTWLSFSGAV